MKLEDVAIIVTSREAPPEPIQPPPQISTDLYETATRFQSAQKQIQAAGYYAGEAAQ